MAVIFQWTLISNLFCDEIPEQQEQKTANMVIFQRSESFDQDCDLQHPPSQKRNSSDLITWIVAGERFFRATQLLRGGEVRGGTLYSVRQQLCLPLLLSDGVTLPAPVWAQPHR